MGFDPGAAMGDDPTGGVAAQRDIVWGLYLDVRAHARHAEVLRSTAVNYVLVIASALVALILSDGSIERAELPLCFAVGVIGLFGIGFVASYTELYQRNRRRSEYLRSVLDSLAFPDTDVTLTSMLDSSDKQHRATSLYRWSRRVTGSSHRFWMTLPLFVIAVGVLLVTIAA